jgi:hypothetical protein
LRYLLSVFCLAATAVLIACAKSGAPDFGVPVDVAVAASETVVGPRFSSGPGGELVLSWMERGDSGGTLTYATYQDGRFATPAAVVSDQRMFVNWADLPSVMPVKGDHWIAHWLRYSADKTYSYDVVVAQSFDRGTTWGEPVIAHTDGTPTEHGFVSMYGERDGIALLWLDGRDTAKETGNNPLDTSMTLRSAVVTPRGERIREQQVDDSVCDCCQTDVAVSSRGPIAVYRDRTAGEIRDIYVTRNVNGQWEPGTRLYEDDWEIAGCPVNGPSIVADGDFVAVAWFSAANNKPVARVTFSHDGGATFGQAIEIASGRIAGYVDLALLDEETAAVSWVGRDSSGSNSINVRRIAVDGSAGPVHVAAQTKQLRVVPQLAYRDDNLIVAWTDEIDEVRNLRVARIPTSLP